MSKFPQHPQGIDARVVPIAPNDVIGVPSHRSEVCDLDTWKLLRPQLETLGRVMALAHCAGTGGPEPIEAVVARCPILPVNHQHRTVLGQFKRFGKGVRWEMFHSHRAIESRFSQWLNGPLGRDLKGMFTGI